MRTRWSKSLVLFILLALVATACGGESPLEGGGGGDDVAAGDDAGGGEGGEAAAECAEGETDGDINLYNWSEYMDPELLTQFEEEYGATVTEDYYPSNEEMLARVQGGASGYDVVVPSDYMVSIMIEENLLLPLSRDAIPNWENIAEDFREPPYDPGLEYSMPYQYGTTGIGYNVAEVGEELPETWGLFFDPELSEQYAGRLQLLDDPRETMGAALKYLGHGLNETSDEALQEAADLISEARGRLAAFSSDQYGDFLVGGETVIGHGFSGTWQFAFVETDNPDDYRYFVPEEGGTIWTDNIAVLADSQHPCTSQTFINFLLDAENGAQLSNWTYYESPNEAAQPMIDEEVTQLSEIDPETEERLEFIEDQGDDEIKFSDFFNRAKG